MRIFSFDPDKHIYMLDGRAIPSVTQVLHGVFGDQAWYNTWSADKGTAIHRAINYYLENRLDVGSIDERITPNLDAFKKFQAETGYTYIEGEIQAYNRQLRFAGTIDLIMIDKSNNFILADLKNHIEPKADLQIAGYSLLYTKRKIKQYCIIGLKDDGNYVLRWVSEIKPLQRTFISCLNVYGWKVKNKLEV